VNVLICIKSMEPQDLLELLEIGFPVETLILRGVIPSRSLKDIQRDRQIVVDAAREGAALVAKFIPPCSNA
jgi:hypothetical protein